MNEQVREIVRNACMQYASAYRTDQLGGSVRERIVDVFTAEIAAIMPKPLDVEVIEKILFDVRDKTIRHYPVPTSLIRAQAQAIAARSCAPVERVCAWKTEDRIAHVVVSTDCGKAFSYPCARCELVDKFGPYCTCGGKIEIEER